MYARVSQWYEQSAENKKVRLQTLHEIEHGGNETAAVAELVSTAVLRRHLETMDRLDIEYGQCKLGLADAGRRTFGDSGVAIRFVHTISRTQHPAGLDRPPRRGAQRVGRSDLAFG